MDGLDIYNKYYKLDSYEQNVISEVSQIVNENLEIFSNNLITFFTSESELNDFFKKDNFKEHLSKRSKEWLMTIFSNKIDSNYIKYITKIGIEHAKNNLPPHYFNVSIGIVRSTLTKLVREYHSDVDKRVTLINAANKILDFNLDVINSTSRVTEIEDKFLKEKLESGLIRFAKGFSHFLNIILVFLLVILSVSVFGFFVQDFSHIIHGNIEKGIITSLGTMLVLWMMIELIEVEITNLKTKKINSKVFISVVIVAFIRKILITTFDKPEIEKQIFFVATVLVLAIVYFLLSKSEKKNE